MTGEQGLPKKIGHYHIRGLLGQGGMGRVYRAEQSGTRRIVALKVLQPGLYGGEARGRFEREVRVLGKLRHPGIAAVYEANTLPGEDGEQPYLAMELVEGRNLMDYVHEAEPDIRARLELVARVCDAVQAAHEAGVVHRDLKPGNILVDETGQPKVLDFGLARFSDVQDSVRTTTGQFLGTPLYMSPEQAGGGAHRAGASSDVYALGVIAYQMLVDRLPYELENRTLPDLIHTILEEEPTPLGSVDRRLRGEIETIVQKALYKEPSRRYQTAAELAEDIRRHLHDEPILARAPTTWYYLVKFTRRHRVFVASIAIVFLVLVVSLVVVVRALTRAVDAEAEARATRDSNLELLVESTELSGRRGKWKQMLDSTELALAAGSDDTVGLTMKRVEALISLNRAQDSEDALAELAKMALTRPQRARMMLWDAELELATDHQSGRAKLEAAVAAGLVGSDLHYALGILAKDASVAVRELELALKANQDHFRAHAGLTFLLLMLGRKDDAEGLIRVGERMFPDALAVHFSRAFLSAIRGESEGSDEWIAPAIAEIGPERTAIVRSAVEFAAGALNSVESIDPLIGRTSLIRAAIELMGSISRISAFQRRFTNLGGDPRDLSLALPLPLVLSDTVSALPGVLVAMAMRRFDSAASTLKDMGAKFPMALFFYLEGIVRYGNHDRPGAYFAMVNAAAVSPLTDSMGDKPLVIAAAAAWEMSRKVPDDKELWLGRAATAVRQIQASAPKVAWIVAGIALESGEMEAARRLCAITIAETPDDSRGWMIRARIAMADRAYPVVLDAARRFEELGGEDAKMDELKADAQAKLAAD